jgi:hypothetical protein
MHNYEQQAMLSLRFVPLEARHITYSLYITRGLRADNAPFGFIGMSKGHSAV